MPNHTAAQMAKMTPNSNSAGAFRLNPSKESSKFADWPIEKRRDISQRPADIRGPTSKNPEIAAATKYGCVPQNTRIVQPTATINAP